MSEKNAGKPKKLSKSDKVLTREEEESNRTWAGNLPKSSHFDIGSYIVMNNRRGLITNKYISASETYLKIAWDDVSVSIIKPRALNRG